MVMKRTAPHRSCIYILGFNIIATFVTTGKTQIDDGPQPRTPATNRPASVAFCSRSLCVFSVSTEIITLINEILWL